MLRHFVARKLELRQREHTVLGEFDVDTVGITEARSLEHFDKVANSEFGANFVGALGLDLEAFKQELLSARTRSLHIIAASCVSLQQNWLRATTSQCSNLAQSSEELQNFATDVKHNGVGREHDHHRLAQLLCCIAVVEQ
jgi:hypothetical protein